MNFSIFVYLRISLFAFIFQSSFAEYKILGLDGKKKIIFLVDSFLSSLSIAFCPLFFLLLLVSRASFCLCSFKMLMIVRLAMDLVPFLLFVVY